MLAGFLFGASTRDEVAAAVTQTPTTTTVANGCICHSVSARTNTFRIYYTVVAQGRSVLLCEYLRTHIDVLVLTRIRAVRVCGQPAPTGTGAQAMYVTIKVKASRAEFPCVHARTRCSGISANVPMPRCTGAGLVYHRQEAKNTTPISHRPIMQNAAYTHTHTCILNTCVCVCVSVCDS